MDKLIIDNTILDELVDGLVEIMGNKLFSVILYGSVAKGTATDESDVDVAVVLLSPMTKEEEERLDEFAADMDLRHNKVFSVIDVEHSELKKWENAVPFYRNLEKEGITLWKAA